MLVVVTGPEADAHTTEPPSALEPEQTPTEKAKASAGLVDSSTVAMHGPTKTAVSTPIPAPVPALAGLVLAPAPEPALFASSLAPAPVHTSAAGAAPIIATNRAAAKSPCLCGEVYAMPSSSESPASSDESDDDEPFRSESRSPAPPVSPLPSSSPGDPPLSGANDNLGTGSKSSEHARLLERAESVGEHVKQLQFGNTNDHDPIGHNKRPGCDADDADEDDEIAEFDEDNESITARDQNFLDDIEDSDEEWAGRVMSKARGESGATASKRNAPDAASKAADLSPVVLAVAAAAPDRHPFKLRPVATTTEKLTMKRRHAKSIPPPGAAGAFASGKAPARGRKKKGKRT